MLRRFSAERYDGRYDCCLEARGDSLLTPRHGGYRRAAAIVCRFTRQRPPLPPIRPISPPILAPSLPAHVEPR